VSGALTMQSDGFRYEGEAGIPHQRARQQVRLAEDLETVADADHARRRPRRGPDRLHDGAEAGDGAGAAGNRHS
jgi:hypothetical protein